MEQSAISALLHFSSSAAENSLKNFGNPSSIHWAGRRVKNAVDDAREALAAAIGLDDPEEILFTGSATEATNTALKGLFLQQKKEGRHFHLVTSTVEHEATLETANFLQEEGAKVHFLSVDKNGEIELSFLEKKLAEISAKKENFILLSLMVGNNETGVVFPYREIVSIAKKYGAAVHLDAVQAPGKLPSFSLQGLAVDLASFSAHKIGGPKGVGALVVRRGVKLVSLLHGGAQERKRRAGTLNVAGIASFGAAAIALSKRDLAKTLALRQHLEKEVLASISGVTINGAVAKERLVNTSNFLFDDVRGESLLMGLDIEGFAVSSGSACNSGSILPSHVLIAMGQDKIAAASACRVSLGPSNTREEIDSFIRTLAQVVDRIRHPAAKIVGVHPRQKDR